MFDGYSDNVGSLFFQTIQNYFDESINYTVHVLRWETLAVMNGSANLKITCMRDPDRPLRSSCGY